MTDCKGLLGKIFGHRFQEYKVRVRPDCISREYKISGCVEDVTFNEFMLMDKYEIRCKRCGAKPKDEE